MNNFWTMEMILVKTNLSFNSVFLYLIDDRVLLHTLAFHCSLHHHCFTIGFSFSQYQCLVPCIQWSVFLCITNVRSFFKWIFSLVFRFLAFASHSMHKIRCHHSQFHHFRLSFRFIQKLKREKAKKKRKTDSYSENSNEIRRQLLMPQKHFRMTQKAVLLNIYQIDGLFQS